MTIDEFKQIYSEIINENTDDMITEGKLFNSFLAGTALTAGTVFGLGKLSEQDKNIIPKSEPTIVQTVNQDTPVQKTIETPKIEQRKQSVVTKNTDSQWMSSIAVPFIKYYEGKVLDHDGNHVLYDDDVTIKSVKRKRKWDGKSSIDAFIKSCKGKPTIGYGETSSDIVRKGKISDAEANKLLENRIRSLDKFLSKKWPKSYNKMNENQKAAFVSFNYNLGRNFIENETKKMKKHLLNGNLDGACYEMHDCDNVTQNGELIKCKGLTNRRQAEMRLFRTPVK
jgi:GH24 family phage-related lysozyme (muramidase)